MGQPVARREESVVRSVAAYLRGLGAHIERIPGSVSGVRGRPDLLGVMQGRALAFEIKRLGEDAAPSQAAQLRIWQNAGAVTGTVHRVEEVTALLTAAGLLLPSGAVQPSAGSQADAAAAVQPQAAGGGRDLDELLNTGQAAAEIRVNGKTARTAAIAALTAAMENDGGDGGWPKLVGNRYVAPRRVWLHILRRQRAMLTDVAKAELITAITSGEIITVEQGIAWVKRQYGVQYTHRGMYEILRRTKRSSPAPAVARRCDDQGTALRPAPPAPAPAYPGPAIESPAF